MIFSVSKGEGDPIVFIHGFAHSHRYWLRVISRIPHTRFLCIAPDNLGFGRSAQPRSNYTIDEQSRELTKLIRHYTDEPVTIVGHSMGATIAAHIARQHPNMVKRLFLVNPTLFPGMTQARPVVLSQVPLFYRFYISPLGWIVFPFRETRFVRLLLRSTTKEHLLHGIFKDYLSHSRRSLVLSLRNLIFTHSIVDDIKSLTLPVNIIYSSDDPFHRDDGLDVIRSQQNVQSFELKGGHKIPLASAESLAALIAT